jgi:hypothetical protein
MISFRKFLSWFGRKSIVAIEQVAVKSQELFRNSIPAYVVLHDVNSHIGVREIFNMGIIEDQIEYYRKAKIAILDTQSHNGWFSIQYSQCVLGNSSPYISVYRFPDRNDALVFTIKHADVIAYTTEDVKDLKTYIRKLKDGKTTLHSSGDSVEV